MMISMKFILKNSANGILMIGIRINSMTLSFIVLILKLEIIYGNFLTIIISIDVF